MIINKLVLMFISTNKNKKSKSKANKNKIIPLKHQDMCYHSSYADSGIFEKSKQRLKNALRHKVRKFEMFENE